MFEFKFDIIWRRLCFDVNQHTTSSWSIQLCLNQTWFYDAIIQHHANFII